MVFDNTFNYKSIALVNKNVNMSYIAMNYYCIHAVLGVESQELIFIGGGRGADGRGAKGRADREAGKGAEAGPIGGPRA